jgi:competence protein ComEC
MQLQKILPQNIEGQLLYIEGEIVSNVSVTNEIDRYTAAPQQKHKFILQPSQHIPEWSNSGKIQLSWINPPQELRLGDVWQLHVKLKRPRNYYNPGSFNLERYCLQQRIAALGYVVDKNKNCLVKHKNYLSIVNLRQKILATLQQFTAYPHLGVIQALMLGDKSIISKSQMQLLQDTGTAHLIVISGMHLSLIATIALLLFKKLCLVLPYNWNKQYALLISSIGSLAVVLFYAQLSGFAVATQRAFIMFLAASLLVIFRRNTSIWQRFWMAVILILIWEPLAILAPGFWYSFLAVAALIYISFGRNAKQLWWQSMLKPQFAISFILLPLSLGVFGQISTVALFANLFAIPFITLLILPLVFAAMLLLLFATQVANPIIAYANELLKYFFVILQRSNLVMPYYWSFPEDFHCLILILATVTMFWLLAPGGMPRRYLALLGLVPIFFPKSHSLLTGQASFTLLDVGQGLSAVIRTQHHTLIYDTGPRLTEDFDLGAKVVVPYLRYQGVKAIDMIIISHADNDHIGGAHSIINSITTENLILNEPQYLAEYASNLCIPETKWIWDGVSFTILHPDPQFEYIKRNNYSCVLLIEAGQHKVLLTGDIESLAEQDLIKRYATQLRADILLVPHHGSKTSSSTEFLTAVQPQFALVAAGYKNQYGHPKAEILQRYSNLGIKVLQTAERGAITFKFGADFSELDPQFYLKH